MEDQVCANINWLIKNKKLTEQELADLAGTTQSYINKIKNGKVKMNLLKVISQISQKCQISLDELLNDNLEHKKNPQFLEKKSWEQLKVFVLVETPLGPQPSFVDLEELSNAKKRKSYEENNG